MSEMYLRQPGVTYSSCAPFTKNKERIQKLKGTGDSQYIYQLKNYTNQLLENSRKVHLPFVDNIWGADLANMQLISKFKKGICFL